MWTLTPWGWTWIPAPSPPRGSWPAPPGVLSSPVPPPPKPLGAIPCKRHGPQPFEGHLLCRKCGRLWQRILRVEPHWPFSTGRCTCDRKLLPTRPDDAVATAVRYCPKCYVERSELRCSRERARTLLLWFRSKPYVPKKLPRTPGEGEAPRASRRARKAR